MKKRVLIVDDDQTIRFALRAFLTANGYEVLESDSVAAAQVAFRSKRPDVAVVDFELPDGDAIELIGRFKAVDAACPVIVLTGHASVALAVRAIQEGAAHFLTKPLDLPALQTIIERCLEQETLRRHDEARRATGRRHAVDPFIGRGDAIRQLETQARRVASSESSILIQGETGSGKGVLARWIHEQSPRARSPFVDLNCAGLNREFLDSELFGYERGAFTGAVNAKQGLFDVAHTGTMFLDEIGDVDPQLQPKLLKVLEEKRFRRLGDVGDRVVDVRLIGATHQDLTAMVREGRFRSDLYFRISTIPLVVPPLRQRADDIPILAEQILEELSAAAGRRDMKLAPGAVRSLQQYAWPGNIRELRNVLERAILLSDRNLIDARDLVLTFGDSSAAEGVPELDLTLEEMERRHIQRVLHAEGGNVPRAAARLAVPRSSLYQKIKRYGLPAGDSEA